MQLQHRMQEKIVLYVNVTFIEDDNITLKDTRTLDVSQTTFLNITPISIEEILILALICFLDFGANI